MHERPADRTDQELLLAWRGGDREAGSALFTRHAAAISRFFRNKLASTDDSSDLLQETFLALLRSNEHACERPTPSVVRGYLYATASNILCAHLRKRYKQQSEKLDFTTVCIQDLDPASMSSIVMKRRESQVFVEALRTISIEDQIILECKYFDDLSLRDMGEMLGVPETTLTGRLQRAKARLRQQVERISTRSRCDAIRSPTDADLERWAGEVREQMAWPGSGSI